MKDTMKGERKNIVRSLVYNLLNNQAFELIELHFDSNMIFFCNKIEINTRPAFRKLLKIINFKYPHCHYEIKNLLAQENIVIAHWMVVIKTGLDQSSISFDGVFIIQFNELSIIRVNAIWNELYLAKFLQTAPTRSSPRT